LTPRVSILLPIYNGAGLLGEAIESALAQSYRDFELLVLDDASVDDGAAIAEGFGDPRVQVIRNERNLGQVATLNRGLQEARGEYVARLDQDDACLPERLERQVALLDAEPDVAVAGTWVDVVDEAGTVVHEARARLDVVVDTIHGILIDRLPLAHPSVMFRRDVVLAADGYDEAVRYCEDMDLWRRLVLAGHELRVVPEPLLRYRRHAGQQSSQHAAEQRSNNEAALERFVGAVAPGVDARLVRMAFTRQLDLWHELASRADGARLADDLRALLDGLGDHFGLDTAQRRELERRLRERVAAAVEGGWRTGVARWRRASPPLAEFGGRRARYALVRSAAPLLALARRAGGKRPVEGVSA
jgi:GT2 family glycosyltransferase